ncbi:MAG: molecular chaperone TorD family protein [Pyrinomonadaceae bacterium]
MELFRSLAALVEPPVAGLAPVADVLEMGPLPAAAEHTELFTFQLYPYASVYLGPEGMMGGIARDRIAGFYVAMKQTPPPEPDHLTDLLAFYAYLCGHEAPADKPVAAEALRHVRKAFLWEHLISWLPPYLQKVRELAGPFYQQWAVLMELVLAQEAAKFGEPEQISSHLLDAPGVVDPRESAFSAFQDSLLASVRSGMILTRADLLTAARQLNIGVRLGERKYILTALFEQDAPGMLEWLAAQAQIWVGRHQESSKTFGETSLYWEAKAAAGVKLLVDLKAGAGAKS